MASSSFKLQSMLRKFKNTSKENIKKNMQYSYKLSIETNELETMFMFHSATKDSYIYTLDIFNSNILSNEVSTIPIPYVISQPITIKSSSVPVYSPNSNHLNSAYDYMESDIQKGYLCNTYNAELCDEEWIAFVFCMNMIYIDFLSNEKIKIKSLHINRTPGSIMSAMNHVLFNSSIKDSNAIEWSWLSTVAFTKSSNSSYSLHSSMSPNSPNSFKASNLLRKAKRKYNSQLLFLLEDNMHSVNNINFIVNETINKLNKTNFLIINTINTNKDHIAHASLIIKLMESGGIFYIKIPNIKEWDTPFINNMLLYSLLFNEVYLYKFHLIGNSTYLLCKYKKKINNETIYKKLVHILSNKDFTNEHNIFSKDFFDVPPIKNWLDTIYNIIESAIDEEYIYKGIPFGNIIDSIDASLSINLNTFF